jgi:hypothetical protein
MFSLGENLECYIFDEYFGEVLSVTILLLVAFSALLFEYDHFITFDMIQDFPRHLGSS